MPPSLDLSDASSIFYQTYYYFLTLFTLAFGIGTGVFTFVVYVSFIFGLMVAFCVCIWDHGFGSDRMSRRLLMYLTDVFILFTHGTGVDSTHNQITYTWNPIPFILNISHSVSLYMQIVTLTRSLA